MLWFKVFLANDTIFPLICRPFWGLILSASEATMRRISLKQQILCRTAMDFDIPPSNPEEPPGDHDTNIQASLVAYC